MKLLLQQLRPWSIKNVYDPSLQITQVVALIPTPLLICTKIYKLNKSLLCLVFVFVLIKLPAQIKPIVISTNSENDLIPEGIAVDPRTGTMYVSSIARQKIIAVDETANHRDFISSNQYGFLEGLGMKIDTTRNLLWAISGKKVDKWYSSQIQAFNLSTGKPEHFYSVKDTIPHLFNDLEIDRNGNIYITDTEFSAFYFVNTEKKKLELFSKNPLIKYPNGISFGKNGELYVATYGSGPVRINIATKEISQLNGYKDSAIAHGLDGLVYWNHSLYGVYNISKHRSGNLVIKYTLNDKGDAIINEEIIEKGNPHFHEPTTAALAENYLYVLANSHLASYNGNKESTKGIENQLTPVKILRYKLN